MPELAKRILEERYLQRHPNGSMESVSELFWRVANTVAQGDKDETKVKTIAAGFYELMSSLRFLPNSPTLMNAGIDNDLQYSACYVLPVRDNVSEIFTSIRDAVLIHKSGGGTGFSFSSIRPTGFRVSTSGGIASGPISFMKVFDAATEAIKQGGRRRGANMGILRVDHPDIEDFIACKLSGEVPNFNISVGISDKFMAALPNDDMYDIIAQKDWPKPDGGRYLGGEVLDQKSAKTIWDKIVDAAWHTGDPGLVFLDKINEGTANPTPHVSLIEATNPCGEQPLLPYESCNLGSINLVKMLNQKKDGIDWNALTRTVHWAVHFLDNVISVNPYPLPETSKLVENNRKIGLGVMGWADLLFELMIPYDSVQALALADRVMEHIQKEGHNQSTKLAETRGCFPNWSESIYAVQGARRNSTITTIAPTGSISIIAGVSSGIEPAFGISYRHIVKNGSNTRVLPFINRTFERVAKERGFWSLKLRDKILEKGSVQQIDEVPEDVRQVFTTAHDISYSWHVETQAAFQKHVDNGVSKTINMPSDATRSMISIAYLMAYDQNCMGITVFRNGCKGPQVLNLGIRDSSNGSEVKFRPSSLRGQTFSKITPVGKAYITINAQDSDANAPFEVFVNVGKGGSDVAADAEGLGRLISLILRQPGHLSPIERVQGVIGQLRGIGSGQALGIGPERVASLADAIAQTLSEFIGVDSKIDIQGLPDMPEHLDSDLCSACGQAAFVREEGCSKCYICGFSTC